MKSPMWNRCWLDPAARSSVWARWPIGFAARCLAAHWTAGRAGRGGRWLAVGLAATVGCGPAGGEVRLSEIMAATSQRLLREDSEGRLRPGSGPHWIDTGFSAPGWRVGSAPLGFGGAAGLGTSVASLMRLRTPTLYTRHVFTATAAEADNPGRLTLHVTFNDGFVAWLNGREAGRANAGPPGHFLYHDQPAYNFATTTNDQRYDPRPQPGVGGTQPLVLDLGPASQWLREGENVLAIQLLNREPDVSARLDAMLEVVSGDAALDLRRDHFDDANGASVEHHRRGGVATTTGIGEPPDGSWLAEARPPSSSPTATDVSLIARLDPTAGVASTGGMRVDLDRPSPSAPVTWYGAPVPLPPDLVPTITLDDLARLHLSFRFRASPEVQYALRIETAEGEPATALGGLPLVTATAGTAAAESVPDDFSDSVGGARTMNVNAAGTSSGGISGSVRNSFTLNVGPAAREFAFRVVEDVATGADAGAGMLRCEITQPAAVPDFFGFTLQTFQVRSWTAGSITEEQLQAVVLQLDLRAPADSPIRVWMEPAIAGAGAAQRLDLGTLTGTGGWQRHELDPSAGTNRAAFLAAMNAQPTTLVRLAFRREAAAPVVGTAWELDNVGFVPWRLYSVNLGEGTGKEAMVSALASQATPRLVPVWESMATATAARPSTLVLDDFRLTLGVENAGTPRTWIPWSAAGWQYWPGLAEPSGGVVESADFTVASSDPGFHDWIEIENSGSVAVALDGWSLTTRRDRSIQWSFPAGTMVPAGGYLMVLASGRSEPPSAADWLHATFRLPAEGGYLALVDAAGAVRDGFDPAYAPQNPFHSYGRNALGHWGYLREATPGSANRGPWAPAEADAVAFHPPGGFHDGAVTLRLTTATPGARIRYTLDGSIPTLTAGFDYSDPLVLAPINDKTGHSVRARAFSDHAIPSAITTQTYLINQHPNLRSAPALVLTGDPGKTFYRPTGILAIQGGTYPSDLWVPQRAADYNIPMGSGRLLDPMAPQRPYERLAHLEVVPTDDLPALNVPVGVRVSSSPYSRPRLRLNQAASASPFAADPTQKPSFNLFFRGDYGAASITYPLIPETTIRRFEELRFRAGKNDISNPFIRDEYVRRLFTDMGQVGTVGGFHGLWINGAYKGYYNLCERIREPFLQNHFPGSGAWDVNYISRFEAGDSQHFDNVLRPRLAANLTVRANYDALADVLNLANAADYYLLMVYTAMWDWPHNNWAMARERTPGAKWRCFVWDAEGGFGLYGNKSTSWNTFSRDLLPDSSWLCFQFQRLMTSPEWRLLFADRIQRHFFHDGCLTDARLTARKNAAAAELAPFLAYARLTADQSWFTTWLNASNGRKRFLFPRLLPGQTGYVAGHLRDPNGDGNLADTLWPVTGAPVPALAPGIVPAGTSLAMTLPAGVPEDSLVYVTLNGADPRGWNGAVADAAHLYDGPMPLNAAMVTVRARTRHPTTGEWSPLLEASYVVGAVPADATNLVISEIMYHPPRPTAGEVAAGFTNADDFEYIALQNIGTHPIDLSGLQFSQGITFNFASATRPVIEVGEQVLLARRRVAVAHRYGAEVARQVVGEFTGGLSNAGERLRLEIKSDRTTIRDFAYGDSTPWPTAADGGGSSLLLRDPATNPDHAPPTHWVASAAVPGQPGGHLRPLTYDDWRSWVFPAALADHPSIAGPDADADGDGWSNAWEFMLLAPPLEANRFPALLIGPAMDANGNSVTVSAPVAPAATGFSITLEMSHSLAPDSWHSTTSPPSDTPQPDGSILRTWQLSWPQPAEETFARFRLVPVIP